MIVMSKEYLREMEEMLRYFAKTPARRITEEMKEQASNLADGIDFLIREKEGDSAGADQAGE